MPNQKSDKEPKERVGYGVKVPPISLEECVKAVKDATRLGGEHGSLDAFANVLDNSRSSSTFYYKLNVMRSFGLLTFDKLNYQITDIGRRIVTPTSMADENKAIHEAFQCQNYLQKTWENYRGKLLPAREYLANYFEKSFGIPAQFKVQWADYFLAAARFAKILAERESGSFQVLYEPLVAQGKAEDKKSGVDTEKGAPPQVIQRSQGSIVESVDSQDWGSINKTKLSNGRVAIFAIPDELTQQDVEKLKATLKGVEAGLDGLKKDESNQ